MKKRFLILIALYSCSNPSNLQRDGQNNCDTSFTQIADTEQGILSNYICIKNGLYSITSLNKLKDTIAVTTQISHDIKTSKRYDQNKVKDIELSVKVRGTFKSNFFLSLDKGIIDKKISTYLLIKKLDDSFIIDIKGFKADSAFFISNLDEFPSIVEFNQNKLAQGIKMNNNRIVLPKPNIDTHKKHVILCYFSEEGLDGYGFRPFYLDSSIIDWTCNSIGVED